MYSANPRPFVLPVFLVRPEYPEARYQSLLAREAEPGLQAMVHSGHYAELNGSNAGASLDLVSFLGCLYVAWLSSSCLHLPSGQISDQSIGVIIMM